MAPLAGPVTWCGQIISNVHNTGEHRRKSTLNRRPLLRGGVVGLYPSERLFYFAEDPNRVGNQIRRTIAFEPRDQLSLTLNTLVLVENNRLADLDRCLGLSARVGRVICIS